MDLSVIDRYIQEKQFKQYNHFLKLSKDTADSNALVSYWSLYCVMLSGIQSQDKNAEFRTFLSNIMTCLEEVERFFEERKQNTFSKQKKFFFSLDEKRTQR